MNLSLKTLLFILNFVINQLQKNAASSRKKSENLNDKIKKLSVELYEADNESNHALRLAFKLKGIAE